MHKKLLFITLAWLCAVTSMADTLTILNRFEKIEHASVLASYRNEFGSFIKPQLDVEFPYALIRVHIDGNEAAVTKAKERFALYLGQHHAPMAKITNRVNEIMFLVPIGAGYVELQCGDGCQPLTLFNYPQLVADAIYEGKVRYALEKVAVQQEPVQSTTTQAPKRQFFKFRVSPADAIVEVEANGQKDMWHVSDGVASKPLNYGTYRYTISANRYHTESGTFLVSDTETEKQVTLQPKFGWLSITSNSAQGAYVYVTNTQTGTRQSLGAVPVRKKDLDAGTYTLLIQKDKYKDYTSNFTIEKGKTLSLDPTLEANFVELTLTTSAQSDMYIDGEKLGIGRWTGTLELGEYVVETRQASHQSAYTTLYVTSKSAGKTIALNNPIPIYGSLMLTSSPADAVVYVDGVKKGLTPLIVNELLIGKHAIRIEKEGYDTQEKKVTILEGQETVSNFALTKTVKPTPAPSPLTKTVKPTPAPSPTPKSNNNIENGHEYVDLGLSVKWATCNVGANKPEEYGDYFAWGETEPKSTYTWSAYKLCRGNHYTQKKYCTSSSYGTVDHKITLDLTDDAAHANWGGSWRMPTTAEQDELREKCTWTWTTQNGVKGYKVTSKINGRSIFLPAAGYRYNSVLSNAGRDGVYWSSSLETNYPRYAYNLYFDSSTLKWYYYIRCNGLSVRPVCP